MAFTVDEDASASTVISQRLFEQLTSTLRAFVRILVIKDELRNWYETDLWLQVIAPFSVAEECSDFCSDPASRWPHLRTSRHTLFAILSGWFLIDMLKRIGLRRPISMFCKQGVTGSIPVTSTMISAK